jgi:CelD/BcsL family acetyltransferase involved in cellulose biosynthesis
VPVGAFRSAERRTGVLTPRRAEDRIRAGSVCVDVISDDVELAGLTSRWQQLVWNSGAATAFATPAAVLTWYRHVARHSSVYAVTVWRGDELVGLAPFSLTRLGGFRLLSTAGAGFGYIGEPLLGADPEPVAVALADHLTRLVSSGAAAVYLRRLDGAGTMVTVLSRRSDLACHPMGPDEASCVVRFDQMPDPEQYFTRAARKHAIGRRTRRLGERFDHVEYVVDDPEPDLALDTMRDMLRRRFDSDLRIFSTAQNRALTRDLVHELISAGHARVSSMIADGRRITVAVDFHVRPRVLGYAVAYEPDLAQFGLGHLELYQALRTAHAEGTVEVDLGSAGFSYKRSWASTLTYQRTLAITAPGWRGNLANRVRRAAIHVHRARPLDDVTGIGPHVV